MVESMIFSAGENNDQQAIPRKPPDLEAQKKDTLAFVSFRDKLIGEHQQVPKPREKVDLI
jgi:hypothetical protein